MTKIVTHSGSFHTDEVFALAALGLHLGHENIEIVRTRDESVIETGDWVVDVGGMYDPARKRFDHHQNGAPVRENGIPYAAFGLIWKEIGEQIAGSKQAAESIEARFALPIDAGDNGITLFELNEHNVPPFAIYDAIGLFRPVWQSGEDTDAAFESAVSFARTLLARAVLHAQASIKLQALARETYDAADDKRALEFALPMPQELFIGYPDVDVIVCPYDPSASPNWQATAVRVSRDSFATRVQFPEAWAGLRDEELAKVSGIDDAVFCHKNRFLFVARSREGARAAVEKTIAA